MSMVSTLTRIKRRSNAIRCNAASPYCTLRGAVMFVLLAFAGVHPKTALLAFLVIMSIAFLLNVAMGVVMAIAEPGRLD